MTARPRHLRRDQGSVSPVIGSILILAISVLGVAGILFWGAPTIDRIQSRNAQAAMEGEFEGLRDASQELSVPDHSRFPTVAVPSGELAVKPGTRFLVAANHDSANPSCDLHVTDWSDAGADKDKVTVSATGCRAATVTCTPAPLAAGACLEVYSVGGTTTVRQTVALAGGVATVSGANFSRGDWMFRLTDGSANPTIYAQAWLHSSDQLAWTLASATGKRELFLDGGAVFSRADGTFFLEKEAALGDTAFGTGYYGLWLRSLLASSYTALNDPGSHQVFLSLLGNAVRVDTNAATKLRFDFSGELAQPWCNALLARNVHLTNALYTNTPGYTCAAGDARGLRSVTYTCSDTTTCVGGVFQFRFLHARIDTSLVI